MAPRSSSPFDAEAVAELEAKLLRKKEKHRQFQLEQQRLLASRPAVLVPESPSPRKKRQNLLLDSTSSTRPTRPAYFDSTLAGPPPPLRHVQAFKPEASVSFTSDKRESKFSSHESALPKSFLSRLQTEQEKAKLDQLRRQRTALRSTGFGLSSTTTPTLEKGDVDMTGLMKARAGTDMKVKARIKDSKGKGKARATAQDEVVRDVKPMISAMTRPKSVGADTTGARKEREPSVGRDRRGRESDDDGGASREASSDDGLDITDGPSKDQAKRRRNKDGTVIEELEMGPIEFDPPRHDPEFERIEPNSGIKLRERIMPHEQVQRLLSDRYHLSPSQIYSLARIDNRRQVHVDVDADFVIIGVLAWKDEIRFLHSNPLAEPRKETPEQEKRRHRYGEKADPLKLPDDARPAVELFARQTKRQKKQRYIRFELVDLSTEQAAASGTGTLNVMLVEADSVDTGYDDDGLEVPIYRGQSGGAYEKYWKESPGAVVAIINPQFLPHSEGRSHTLKPLSADSMVVLGRARDLTFCDAIKKKDGQKCNSWVDARVGTKCQYHIHLAVNRTGMGRAETFGNTASLKQTASIDFSKLKNSLRTSHAGGAGPGAAPTSRTKPLAFPPSSSVMVQGHTTYVAGGSRAGGGGGGGGGGTTVARTSDLSALVAGGIGLPTSRGSGGFIPGVRDGPVVTDEVRKKEREKADRVRARHELKALGKLDGGASVGGEYLRLARARDKERKKRERERERDALENQKKAKKKNKTKQQDDDDDDDDDQGRSAASSDSSDSEDQGAGGDGPARKTGKRPPERKKIFSSEAVRMIGYNPTLRPGDARDDRKDDDETLQQRLALEGGVRQAIKLTAPAGKRVISGVDIDPDTVVSAKRKKPSTKTTTVAAPSSSKPLPRQEIVAVEHGRDEDEDDDDLFIEGAPTERVKVDLRPRPRPLDK